MSVFQVSVHPWKKMTIVKKHSVFHFYGFNEDNYYNLRVLLRPKFLLHTFHLNRGPELIYELHDIVWYRYNTGNYPQTLASVRYGPCFVHPKFDKFPARKIAYPGWRFIIKMLSCQYVNPHYKDKTVSRPSYLHNENPYTRNHCSYWNGPLNQNSNLFSRVVGVGVGVMHIMMIRGHVLGRSCKN